MPLSLRITYSDFFWKPNEGQLYDLFFAILYTWSWWSNLYYFHTCMQEQLGLDLSSCLKVSFIYRVCILTTASIWITTIYDIWHSFYAPGRVTLRNSPWFRPLHWKSVLEIHRESSSNLYLLNLLILSITYTVCCAGDYASFDELSSYNYSCAKIWLPG